jgi:hypothetical protein
VFGLRDLAECRHRVAGDFAGENFRVSLAPSAQQEIPLSLSGPSPI